MFNKQFRVLAKLHVAPGNRLDVSERCLSKVWSCLLHRSVCSEGVTPKDLHKSTWPLLEEMPQMTHFLLVTLRLDLTMCFRLYLNLC